MSLDARSLLRLITNSSPLIVHHWDADGVISAVTVARFVSGRASFLVPNFTYDVDQGLLGLVRSGLADRDLLLVLDYNASPRALAALTSVAAAEGAPVVVLDHHVARYPRVAGLLYYNPAADGDPEGLWPSAAHVAADAIGFYDPLLVAASIYGDLQDEAVGNRVFRKYMEEAGLDPVEDAGLPRDCSMQVWGAEAHRDARLIAGLAYELTYGAADPCQALLSDPRLTNMRLEAEKEVEEAVEGAEVLSEGPVKVVRVRTRLRVGGMVARRLSRLARGILVAIVEEEGSERARIYVRGSEGFDPLAVYRALSPAVHVGAKNQRGNKVVSLEVSRESVSEIVEAIRSSLEAHGAAQGGGQQQGGA
mgnify:CR=1 FL=1